MKHAYYTKYRNETIWSKSITDKKFMIVSVQGEHTEREGFAGILVQTAAGIKAAVENDYIPVVDWKNYPFPCYNYEAVGKENIWEYYFEQPCGYTLEEAFASQDFYFPHDISSISGYEMIDYEDIKKPESDKMKFWHKFFSAYIRFNQETKAKLENVFLQLTENLPYLGVLARGTDYVSLQPSCHHKVMDTDDLISAAKKIMEERGCRKLFLATEDLEVLEKFSKVFKSQLCYVSAQRYRQMEDKTINQVKKKGDGYNSDLNYLAAIYLLSRADYMIGTGCGAIQVSAMMNPNHAYFDFIDIGKYRHKGIVMASGTTEIVDGKRKIIYLHDKPMIYYAFTTLLMMDIREFMIIALEEEIPEYEKLFGDGRLLGLEIHYGIQRKSGNLAEGLLIAKEFIQNSRVCLISADNVFYGSQLGKRFLDKCSCFDGAYIWGIHTAAPANLYTVEMDSKNGVPVKIRNCGNREDLTIPELYIFDRDVLEIAEFLSVKENDFNICRLIQAYIERKKLFAEELGRGVIWLKAMDQQSRQDASHLIEILQKKFPFMIGSVEETLYNRGILEKKELEKRVEIFRDMKYGEFLKNIIRG